MNNKGFMMAEVVVVASIVLVFLMGLYLSYNKIYSLYNDRVDYYDAVTLYRLVYYRDQLIENSEEESDFNAVLQSVRESSWANPTSFAYANITDLTAGANLGGDKNRAYLIHNRQRNLVSSVLGSESINQTFRDYIDFLSTSENLTNVNYVMIMERCIDGDANNCKYAYLEVYDGLEE